MNDRDKLATTIVSHWNKTASFPLHLPKGRARWLVFSQMLISLALAMFFWTTLTIAQSKILEKIVTVPVGYIRTPPNLTLVEDIQKDVRLHLAGPKSDLASINLEQLSVKIDLSKTVAGRLTFPITSENIKLPGDVELVEAIPSSVELTLAEIEEGDVIIEPQLVGKLPGGMKILSIKLIPKKVKVLTPATTGNNREVKVITTPIYLDSIYNDAKIFCKVIAPPAVQPANKQWPDVEVEIKVGY